MSSQTLSEAASDVEAGAQPPGHGQHGGGGGSTAFLPLPASLAHTREHDVEQGLGGEDYDNNLSLIHI